ncbi:MAG: hypothetical protein L6V93_09115 [Clostridiales bacterium]|nr:MAG: hypothetical protein L6V93_09115 [Clostridiales bacterium]
MSAGISFDIDGKQALLEEIDVTKRLEMLVDLIDREIKILSVERDINRKVSGNIDKNQKDYYLREQLKVIRTELGDSGEIEAEAEELKDKLVKANAPEYVLKKADKRTLAYGEKCSREIPRLRLSARMLNGFAIFRGAFRQRKTTI